LVYNCNMENRNHILDNKEQVPNNFEDKEDVLAVKEKIKQELESVKILKNNEGKLLTLEGLESEYQDEEVYKFINTPTFKSWYHGATTERGEPVSFWHTASEAFDKFDPNLIGSSRGFANLGAGFYLSPEQGDREIYLKIAKQKMPHDEEKKLAILNHRDNKGHLSNEIRIINEKLINLRDVSLASYEKYNNELKEWIDKINIFTSKNEGFTYDNPTLESFDIKEPSLFLKMKLLFDTELKNIIDLKLKIKKILERKDSEMKVFKEKENELYSEKKSLEQKYQKEIQQIDNLIPKGVDLRIFTNVKSILNFNEPVDHDKLSLIKNKLKEKGFDPTQLDQYLAKKDSGEMLYNGLAKIITGKEFKHHLSLEEGEKQVDTKPVSAFLSENSFYDATLYTVLIHTHTAPFGQKTMVVYNTNDLLIVPDDKK